MIPFFIIYRKQAIPYYVALLTHIFIGDFFTGGCQLFWPITEAKFGALNFNVMSLPVAITELTLFLVTLPIMYKLKDLQTLFKPHNKNWILIIPIGAVFGPLLQFGRGAESVLPALLVVPSTFYIVLFAYSLFIEFRAQFQQKTNRLKPRNYTQSTTLVRSLYHIRNFCKCNNILSFQKIQSAEHE